ncbi:hypothetical protein SFC55_20395 [Niallia taxi]|uniref:hypothetical protein n=1 Tax=Niallia taxi TaxID=2499688 RepID=UPI003981A0B9
MANQLDQFMYSRYGEISALSNLNTFQDAYETEEITKLLNKYNRISLAIPRLDLLMRKGFVKASTNNVLLGVDIPERAFFKEATEKTFIVEVHEAVLIAKLVPNPSGELLQFVDINTSIFNSKREFKGVLATHISWEWAKEVETCYRTINT